MTLAEHLEAPVATTFQGKGVFPESHPLFLWNGFGAAAPPFARAIAERRVATLAVGCRFGEVGTGSYGLEPPRPLVHVDIDPAVPGRNYETDIAVAADAAAFVRALLPRLTPRPPDEALRTAIRTGHERVWSDWLAHAAEDRVTPARLLRALQEALGPDTIFTSDSGNGTFLAMECLRLERPGRFLAPVDYSCMGYAVPAALGARLARPDCPVVALAGDGALLMTGLELLTAVHQGLAVAVFVLRDRELAQIAQFQATALNRKTASELPDYDAGGLARAVGVEALSLSRDADIPATLDRVREMLATGRPVLVDVAIDYSRKTFFTAGVVKTNLLRFSWPERLRFIGRALNAPAARLEQAPHDEPHVRRPLGEPPHVPGEPMGAVADQHAHLDALGGEGTLRVGADAVQHVHFVAPIGLPDARLFADAVDEVEIMRAEHRRGPARRHRVEQPHRQGVVLRVHVPLAGEGDVRGLVVRALHQTDRGGQWEQGGEVLRRPPEIRLETHPDARSLGPGRAIQIERGIDVAGFFHVDPQE